MILKKSLLTFKIIKYQISLYKYQVIHFQSLVLQINPGLMTLNLHLFHWISRLIRGSFGRFSLLLEAELSVVMLIIAFTYRSRILTKVPVSPDVTDPPHVHFSKMTERWYNEVGKRYGRDPCCSGSNPK